MITPYWIITINECRIGISPRPSGGSYLKGELEQNLPPGSTLIVSLLQDSESKYLHLTDEKKICESLGLEFLNFPIPDRSIPGYSIFKNFIDGLYAKTKEFDSVLIHCRAGIGRSSLIVIGMMIRNGKQLDEAINHVAAIRGFSVPQSTSQKKLISKYYNEVDLTEER